MTKQQLATIEEQQRLIELGLCWVVKDYGDKRRSCPNPAMSEGLCQHHLRMQRGTENDKGQITLPKYPDPPPKAGPIPPMPEIQRPVAPQGGQRHARPYAPQGGQGGRGAGGQGDAPPPPAPPLGGSGSAAQCQACGQVRLTTEVRKLLGNRQLCKKCYYPELHAARGGK